MTLDAPTLRSYDSEGNLLTFTDPVGNTTSYAYDDLDRLTSETITLGVNAVSRDYVYNAQGNLEEVVDRNGRQRTFEYDRLDRRTYERWWNSTNDEIATLGWQYDSLGRVTQARDTQDADTSPDHYVESFFYDALDRVTAHYNYDASATLATTNPPVVQLYAYDLLEASDASDFVRTGYQQWVVDAFGFATLANSTFFTDRLGRLARLTETAGAVDNLVEKQIDFAYDANDRLTGIRRVSGQFDTGYAYDRAGRVTGISHLATGNSQLPFTSYSYGYDKADRIIGQISEHDKTLGAFSDSSVLATDVELFQFDDAGQLKQDGQRTYDYDAGGNRDDASITVGEHNRLLEDANYGYIYDLEGNLTTRFVDSIDNGVFDPGEDYTVYTWDYRNRLTRVKDFNGTTLEENTKYRYNADDQQVEREAFIGAFQTAHEHYVYDGAQRVLALDPDGDLKHRYTWGPGVDQLLVDEVFDSSTNLVEETLFAANDHLGSVNQLVDNSGTVVEHREYDSFGAIDKVFDEVGTDVGASAMQSDIGFAGRPWDNDAQLSYNDSRWYSVDTGRFIGEDIGFIDGPNLYVYAGSDPINFRDPTGRTAQHPLDVFAGGHGSGVTRPANENIDFGSTASFTTPSFIDSSPSFNDTIFGSSNSTPSFNDFGSSFSTTTAFAGNLGLLDPNPEFTALGRGFAAEVERRANQFNPLTLVDSNSLSTIDRILLDPSTPQIASIRQIGNGGVGTGLLQEGAQLGSRASQANSASEAFFLQFAGSGRQLAGSTLQAFTENSPSHEITFVGGRTNVVLGGELTTEAAANTTLVLANPALGGTVRASQAARTAQRTVVTNLSSAADDGLTILNPNFAPNTQRVLQNVTNRAFADISQNPGLARRLLKPREFNQLRFNGRFADAQFGNAIERRAAEIIESDSSLNTILIHASPQRFRGKFVRSNDFVGIESGGIRGFDLTTFKEVPGKLNKPGSGAVEFVIQPGKGSIKFK